MMRTTSDDILVVRTSGKPVVREASQDWHANISHATDDSVAEVVILDACRQGAWPLRQEVA